MNTIRAVESLTRTGFSEEQARAVVGVVVDVVDDTAATKVDFVELKAALHKEVADVSRQLGTLEAKLDAKLDARVARLEASIANAKVQMVLYTGAIVAGIATISRLFD